MDTPYAAEQQALGRRVGGDPARRRHVESTIATIREVWTGRAGRASGFLRPDPPPKIVVGAFGPKMAELAGRVGDGINLQAGHPGLDRLAGLARDAYRKRGKEPDGFVVTAFAGLDERWVHGGGAEQARLDDAGVDRLILLVTPGRWARSATSAGSSAPEPRSRRRRHQPSHELDGLFLLAAHGQQRDPALRPRFHPLG